MVFVVVIRCCWGVFIILNTDEGEFNDLFVQIVCICGDDELPSVHVLKWSSLARITIHIDECIYR